MMQTRIQKVKKVENFNINNKPNRNNTKYDDEKFCTT